MRCKMTDKRYFGKYKVKVVNTIDGRTDVHDGLSKEDISWLRANPNLHVEIVQVNKSYSKNRHSDK